MRDRVMALDVGDRRIGVAISDPFNSYAIPLDTYFRGAKLEDDIENLLFLAEREGAGRIVLGLPLNADGTPSIQTEKTQKFIALLTKKTSLPVETEDERYTTLEARRDLMKMGISAKGDKKKKTVDSLAAAYILESYLARRKDMSMKEERHENAEEETEDNIVELIDEEGVKHEFEHLMTFEYKKEWYVALTPALEAEEADEDEDGEGDDVAIYHLVGGEDDEQLETVEDETLLDELFEEFCRLYDEDESDESEE